jgi:diguanylate cyclase (GGDEF)-like protein
VQQLDLITALQAGQAIFGLIMALLLIAFLREFKHAFLRHCALSCFAMACYFGAVAVLLGIMASDGVSPTQRLALSAFSQAAAYLHVVWLMIGAWEAVNDRSIGSSRHLLLVAFGAAIGIGTALIQPFDADAAWLRLLLRFTVVHVVTGLAFIITASMLWRALKPHRMLSSRLTPLAFGGYGAYLLFLGGQSVWINYFRSIPDYVPYLGLIGFLLLILIGYSIIIWLLEIERRRAASALQKVQSAEERLVHLRGHDAATGLPNRRQLQDLLFHEIRSAAVNRQRVGVLSIGIHRFNLVSQALGWNKTDALIRRLAGDIKRLAPKGVTLGRVGDRDFLMIIPHAGHPQRLIAKARRILDEGATPLSEGGRQIYLSLIGGLCFAPDDEIDAVALINMAQQAQMRAAEAGETLLVHRANQDASQPHDLLQLERELRSAVKDRQFCLHFQPLVSLRARRITGFEALLRWNHPERGILTPGSFLQEAERLGVLDELEDQILAGALSQLKDWQSDFSLPPITASVNLSAPRFQQPGLADKLSNLFDSYDIEPGRLHIEITESTAMDDFETGLNTISNLQQLGCKVCLDDFGTGYSSLAHLRRLQVDYVKLDRSFLTNIDRDPQERGLTRAIVDLIHSLGMTVLAEGVETRQQLGHMIQCRVDVVQGYLLGRPAPAAQYQGAFERPQIVLE